MRIYQVYGFYQSPPKNPKESVTVSRGIQDRENIVHILLQDIFKCSAIYLIYLLNVSASVLYLLCMGISIVRCIIRINIGHLSGKN